MPKPLRLAGILVVFFVLLVNTAWPATVRLWSDKSGKFRARAEFVSLVDGKVTLKRPGTKKTVTLALDRLSEKDQAFIKKLLQKQAASKNADADSKPPAKSPAETDVRSTDDITTQPTPADLESEQLTEKPAQPPGPSLTEPATDTQSPKSETVPPPKSATASPAKKRTPTATRRAPSNVVNSVRGAVFRTQTMNNLRQLALALVMYESQNGKFPPAAIFTRDGKPGLSWRVAILPMLEEEGLYRQFKLDEPWDSPHNKKLVDSMPEIFRSPGANLDDGHTNYLAVTDADTVIAKGRKGTQLQNVRDGASRTAMLVEADDNFATPWTKPDDYDWDRDQPAYGLGGIWSGTFVLALADGSVKRLAADAPATFLNALFSRDGQETVELPE